MVFHAAIAIIYFIAGSARCGAFLGTGSRRGSRF
jgi:hypothetical protein